MAMKLHVLHKATHIPPQNCMYTYLLHDSSDSLSSETYFFKMHFEIPTESINTKCSKYTSSYFICMTTGLNFSKPLSTRLSNRTSSAAACTATVSSSRWPSRWIHSIQTTCGFQEKDQRTCGGRFADKRHWKVQNQIVEDYHGLE